MSPNAGISHPRRAKEKHLYRIRWTRRNWAQWQGKNFLDPRAARLFVGKLRSDDRPDLAPVIWLEVVRRELGPEEVLYEWPVKRWRWKGGLENARPRNASGWGPSKDDPYS